MFNEKKNMADLTKNGIIVNPSTGSGDTTLKVKAQVANRGNRVKQTATFTVTAPGVSESKTFTANHLPAAEFVSFDNGSSQAVDKAGGKITITGTSNSSTLTFTKGSGEIITADISALSYTANGSDATNGVEITDDPGASAKYAFSIELDATTNDTIETRTQQITVRGASTSVTATITLNQTAGDPTLSIDPTSVDVPQDGSEVSVQVTTNTTFTVS